MKQFIPESLKILTLVTIFFAVFALISNQDYHEMFDIIAPREYNCSQVEKYLIGGWHPDIPREVIEKCRKLKEEKYNVKTI